MKKFKTYFALALICLCVILQMESFAQFGETTYTEHDIGKEIAMYNKYKKECERVQTHNEWVKKEEHRLIEGRTDGVILILVGIGLLTAGIAVRKLN